MQQQQQEEESSENDNVTNWIKSMDNTEMALKAIPDLLNYLLDEDALVVSQSSIVLNQMSRQEVPRQALIHTADVVPCIVNSLYRTNDMDTAKNLVGALYGISTQKPQGVQVICAFEPTLALLLRLLGSGIENIVSYAITTIHNVLLESNDHIKNQMRRENAVQYLIPLLICNNNVKFLSIVVDCLYYLVVGNQEAKIVMLNFDGTQNLITLLYNHTQQYPKLIYNIMRTLKVLSVCVNNKKALLGMNAMQTLLQHLIAASSTSSAASQTNSVGGGSSMSRDIIQNSLTIMRNLSDVAANTQQGLAPFITSLFGFLATTQEPTQIEVAACILSNLTTGLEENKSAAVKANAIPILLKHITHYSGLAPGSSNMRNPKIVEPCLCALRHLTTRYADAFIVQDQVRAYQGLGTLTTLMSQYIPRNWSVTKALLGVVRNFVSNPSNNDEMRKYGMIQNVTTILYDAFTIIWQKTQQGRVPTAEIRLDGINMYEIVEAAAGSLAILAKDFNNKIIMRDLDCIGFFMQLFGSPLAGLQRPAASILAELADSRECASVLLATGCRQFIEANYLAQLGQMPPSGVTTTGTQALIHYVAAIYEKLSQINYY